MTDIPVHFRKWRNQCEICNRVFDRPSRLKKHLLLHEAIENSAKSEPKPENMHNCPHCPYTTQRKFCLISHLRTHSGKRYKCEPCNKSFKQKRTLLVHMRRDHTGERPYTCSFCNQTFFATYTLRSHIEKKHSEGPVKRKPHKFCCTQCSYTTDRKHRLDTHIQNHSIERPYGCELCEKAYIKRSYLMHHLRIRHKGELPFACSFCDKRFASTLTLRSHVEKHHTNDDKTEPRKRIRKQSDPKHRCSQCYFTTRRKSSLMSHMRTHVLRCPYKCELCDKIFSHKGTVMIHLRRIHNMMKLYVCPSCDKILYSLSSFNAHIEKYHCEEFQHACASCDRRYTSVFSLRSHINRDHSKEFENVCSYCNQRFRTPQGLQRHVKNKHPVKEETEITNS